MGKSPKYTRRHYEAAAARVKAIDNDLERAKKADTLAQTYHADNPPEAGGSYGFRASRWYEACNVAHSIPLFSVHHQVARVPRPTRGKCRICGGPVYGTRHLDGYAGSYALCKCSDCYYGHLDETTAVPAPNALLVPAWLESIWPDTWQEMADRILLHSFETEAEVYTVPAAMKTAAWTYTALNRERTEAAKLERLEKRA